MINKWSKTPVPKFCIFPVNRSSSSITFFFFSFLKWGSPSMAFCKWVSNIVHFGLWLKHLKTFYFHNQHDLQTGHEISWWSWKTEYRTQNLPNTWSFAIGKRTTCTETCGTIWHREILNELRNPHHSGNWIAMSTVSR